MKRTSQERASLGDQELALLTYVSEHGPLSAGAATARFGEPNGLARSTVETVLARLDKKGFLTRKKADGVFAYEATTPTHEVVGGLVDRFVQGTLGGSLVPLVTYFARQNRLSEAEMQELRRLVSKLEGAEK